MAADEDDPITTMQEYLQRVIGVEREGSRDLLIRNGFRSFDYLVGVGKDHVKDKLTAIRRMKSDPEEDYQIPTDVDDLLKCLVVWCKFTYLTQQDLDFDEATLEEIRDVYHWWEGNQEVVPDKDMCKTYTLNIKPKEWFGSFENVLSDTMGPTHGFPLLYVLRRESEPLGDQDELTGDYSALLATRGRHDGHFWRTDNQEVWRLVRDRCTETSIWSSVEPYKRRRNGNGAYNALKMQLMGRDYARSVRASALKTLQENYWDGTKSFPFVSFIGRFREAFNDLGPDNQPTEEAKIDYLLNGFKCESLNYAAGAIRDNDQYTTFEAAVGKLQSKVTAYLRKKKGHLGNRNVSSVQRGGGSGGNKKKRGKGGGKGGGKQ